MSSRLKAPTGLAGESAGAPVKDCTITVPPYFTATQRQAMLDAARLAGLTPLSLINAGTAAAVNYAIKGKIEDQPRYMMVYDMGAMGTHASVFEIKQVNETRGKFVKKNVTVGVLETIGVGWDAALGGVDFDTVLAEHFVAHIASQRPTLDVKGGDGRAWARLLNEAAKVKEVLSANKLVEARVEGLSSDYDFRLKVTREEFEALAAELIERAVLPIETALAQAGVTAADLGLAEVVGGGWRIPAVQARLKTALGRDSLDQHINGDEGAVMGAAFFGASLAPGFRVKDFKIKDLTPYAIDIDVQSAPIDAAFEDARELLGEDPPLDKAATLWKAGSRLRSKKTLTFHTARNLSVTLNYNEEAPLPATQPRALGHFSCEDLFVVVVVVLRPSFCMML